MPGEVVVAPADAEVGVGDDHAVEAEQHPLQIALHACAGVTSAVSVLVPSMLLASAPGVDWFVGLFGGAPTARSGVGRVVVSGRRGSEPECVAALDPERLLVRSLEWSLDPALRQRLELDVTEADFAASADRS
ncbi:MAG: hypothetical protein KIT58_24235 [Planctomycetota bacterium]|nr:hypothetical protein [Planctomycetota bacterium]